MSSKNKGTASPHGSSKLPKFLQKQNKDRSRSATEDSSSSGSSPASSSSSSASSSAHLSNTSKPPTRSSSRLEGQSDKDAHDEIPVLVEPSAPTPIPRPRTRSERRVASDVPTTIYASTAPSQSSNLPSRLSGWLSHTFNSSSSTSNDLSLPSILTQQSLGSPKAKSSGTNALLMVARHGKGHLDKAMRYLLDSDATPDKCTDPIWLLGVQHPGYEPPPPPSLSSSTVSITPTPSRIGRRASISIDYNKHPPSSPARGGPNELSQSVSPSAKSNQKDPSLNWSPVFYSDFTTRIWCTYRSHFQPIRDTNLAALDGEIQEAVKASGAKKWSWAALAGEKGWTSDSGWGCMLRTGQSLLANTLLHMHLGRDWRRPSQPVQTADYAMYVRIVTWFFDTPSPQAPFSVHRMALAGKELGKDVGQWFGPSTAAGAIKTLVHMFPQAGLGVAISSDSVVYETEVFHASHTPHSGHRMSHHKWGDRPVLVLVGIRLGIDGVNPVYYEAIKELYTYPQSVGIAGGRPSSSYYFVGSQADSLFYLDPHHARPAVPLRNPGENTLNAPIERPNSSLSVAREPTSPRSTRTNATGSSTFSSHAPSSPSPLQQQHSTSSTSTRDTSWSSSADLHSRELGIKSASDLSDEQILELYSDAELKTYHCDRVRKMPLSGLDPSMLIGFLVKTEADWKDLRHRIAELSSKHKPIFTIQDEPPTWPSDSDDNMGLESMIDSDPDEFEGDEDEEEEEEEESNQFFDAGANRSSFSLSGKSAQSKSKTSEADTEDDPIDPITPGPHSRMTFEEEYVSSTLTKASKDRSGEGTSGDNEEDDDDDDWVVPTPSVESPQGTSQTPLPAHSKSASSASSMSRAPSQDNTSGSSKKARSPSSSQIGTVPSSAKKSSRAKAKQQEHFPFPVSPDSPPVSTSSVDSFTSYSSGYGPETSGATAPNGKRMNVQRARDGGRTQSGGVKGILTEP